MLDISLAAKMFEASDLTRAQRAAAAASWHIPVIPVIPFFVNKNLQLLDLPPREKKEKKIGATIYLHGVGENCQYLCHG